MSMRVDKVIAIIVEVEDIETVLEFTRVNLDMINEEEFRHVHNSASAVQESVYAGRSVAWDEYNDKDWTN